MVKSNLKSSNKIENMQQVNNKILLDMERFETYVLQLRETYAERQINNLPLKVKI